MIDRVEISIIEEQQPRWLSFLNKQQDLIERIAKRVHQHCGAQRQTAPNLQRRTCSCIAVLAADLTMSVYNMDNPVIGGYTPDKVALRRAINLAHQHRSRRFGLRARTRRFLRSRRSMPNTVGLQCRLSQ